MLRRLALAALLALAPTLAFADSFAIVGPTPTTTDNSKRLATTEWVNNFFATGLPLPSGKIFIGSAGNIAAAQTVSGDGTLSIGGALTLATVNGNVGTFGSATACVTVTNNAKGLTTAISAATCTPAIGSITGLGTGIAAALAVNVGSAGAPVLFNGAGGTPSSLTLTNGAGLPPSTGLSVAVPFTKGGCNGVTQQANFDNCAPTATRAGDIIYWNGTHYVTLPGNNSGSQVLQENASGVPSWTLPPGAGAFVQASPGNPAATASGAGVMMGLGATCTVTPLGTRIDFSIQGHTANTTSATVNVIALRYGTGAAPANAAAAAGTQVGSAPSASITAANQDVPFKLSGRVSGLTAGIAYWFDIDLATTGGSAVVASLSCDASDF